MPSMTLARILTVVAAGTVATACSDNGLPPQNNDGGEEVARADSQPDSQPQGADAQDVPGDAGSPAWDLGHDEDAAVPPDAVDGPADLPSLDLSLSVDGDKAMDVEPLDQSGARIDGAACVEQVLQVPDGLLPATMDATAFELVFSPDGQRLAARLRDSPYVWMAGLSGDNWRPIVPPGSPACLKNVFGFRFFPDGQTFAAEYCGGFLAVWNENQVGSVQTFGTVASYAISPDGRLLATSAAAQISFFKPADGSLVRSFDYAWHPSAVEFASGGAALVAGGPDSTIRLLDVASGAEIAALPAAGATRKLAVSRDGGLLGAMTTASVLEVWRLADYRRVGAIPVDPQSASFAFSADGRFLVTSGAQLSIYGTDDLSPAGQIPGLTHAVAVSPDGRVAASQPGNQITIYCL